jgi:hypothetical protein
MFDLFPLLYIFIFLFTSLDFVTLNKKNKFITFFFLVFLLIFFVGLRNDIDNDFYNYTEIFNQTQNISIKQLLDSSTYLDSYIELGYRILNYILSLVSSNYHIIFLFSAFLSIFISGFVIFKLSPYPFVSLLLYLSHNLLLRDMMQIRAGIACSLCFLALYFLIKNKKIKSFFTVLIGSTFHLVSISYVFFTFITYISLFYNKKFLTLLFVLAILMSIFYPLGNIFKIISFGDFFGKLSGYANNEYFQSLSFWNPVNIKNIIICSICLLNYNLLKEKIVGFDLLFLSYFIGIVWWLLFIDFGIIAGRVSTVFTTVEIILVPILIKFFFNKKRSLKFIAFSLILFFCTLNFYINIYIRDYFKPYLIF